VERGGVAGVFNSVRGAEEPGGMSRAMRGVAAGHRV